MEAKGKTRNYYSACQHGEFRHVSVSERQRSRPCGQDLCEPFVRAVLATKVKVSDRAMAADSTAKVHVSPPPRCAVVSLHDSDHDGVVRISVDPSCVL